MYSVTLTVTDKDGDSVTSSTTVTVLRQVAWLDFMGATQAAAGGQVTVAAKLTHTYPAVAPLVGFTVSFTRGDQTVSAVTDQQGVASATLTFLPGYENRVVAAFAGDDLYYPASDFGAFEPTVDWTVSPVMRPNKSRKVALVPDPSGFTPNGGQLSNKDFAGGYAPTFTNVNALLVGDATVPNPLIGYDTVVLNGICDIGDNNIPPGQGPRFLRNETFRNRLETFVLEGGKLLIWDSECQNTDYPLLPALRDQQPRGGRGDRHPQGPGGEHALQQQRRVAVLHRRSASR